VRGGLYLEPGVVGGGGEKRLQIVTPLRGCVLVGLDPGVLAAVEQQRRGFSWGTSDNEWTAPNTT
jgi:hypothetical protein